MPFTVMPNKCSLQNMRLPQRHDRPWFFHCGLSLPRHIFRPLFIILQSGLLTGNGFMQCVATEYKPVGVLDRLKMADLKPSTTTHNWLSPAHSREAAVGQEQDTVDMDSM